MASHNSSISKYVSHWYPYILHLDGMVKKLFALPLFSIGPISGNAVIYPGPLEVGSRGPLHKHGSLCGSKVPHGLNVVVLGEVLGQMFFVTGEDVDHAPRKVGGVKYLKKSINQINQKINK